MNDVAPNVKYVKQAIAGLNLSMHMAEFTLACKADTLQAGCEEGLSRYCITSSLCISRSLCP